MNISNQVTLIGNLGNEFEVKEIGNGRTLAKTSFATNESYKDKNGELVSNTQWHNLVVWGKRGQILANNTKKGSMLAIRGKIDYNKYEDKEGQTKYFTSIIVNDFRFLDRKNTQDAPF